MRRELEQKIIAREMSAIKEFNVLDNESVKKNPAVSLFKKVHHKSASTSN